MVMGVIFGETNMTDKCISCNGTGVKTTQNGWDKETKPCNICVGKGQREIIEKSTYDDWFHKEALRVCRVKK